MPSQSVKGKFTGPRKIRSKSALDYKEITEAQVLDFLAKYPRSTAMQMDDALQTRRALQVCQDLAEQNLIHAEGAMPSAHVNGGKPGVTWVLGPAPDDPLKDYTGGLPPPSDGELLLAKVEESKETCIHGKGKNETCFECEVDEEKRNGMDIKVELGQPTEENGVFDVPFSATASMKYDGVTAEEVLNNEPVIAEVEEESPRLSPQEYNELHSENPALPLARKRGRHYKGDAPTKRRKKIISYLRDHPRGGKIGTIAQQIGDTNPNVNVIIGNLFKEGMVLRRGAGTRVSPYIYFLAELQDFLAEEPQESPAESAPVEEPVILEQIPRSDLATLQSSLEYIASEVCDAANAKVIDLPALKALGPAVVALADALDYLQRREVE
jgi:hypothetical protein